MTNSTMKDAIYSAKYWLLEIFAIFAVSLLLPVEVLAKESTENCSYTGFDHLAALYFRQIKVQELKNSGRLVISPVISSNLNTVVKVGPETAKKSLMESIESERKFQQDSIRDKVAPRYAEGEAPDKIVKAVITAYTSTPDQTDSTPDIAASGKKVYDGMIAANWLPFGTKVKIPALYGDKVFTVDDRMNKRYGYGRMDVWLDTSKVEAKKFGVKRVEVHIFLEKKAVAKLTVAK